jgi:hypothetical protein
MEPRFGHDFSHVRVHADGESAAAAQCLGANAFTFDDNVFFARGAYAPNYCSGRELMAHELAHVVQSDEGRAGMKKFTELQVSRPTDPLEREANMLARSAVEQTTGIFRPKIVSSGVRRSAGSTGMLLRDDAGSEAPAGTAGQEVAGTQQVVSDTTATALSNTPWSIAQWTTNVRRSADFSVRSGGSVSVSGTLTWNGPGTCIRQAPHVELILYRRRWIIPDSNEGNERLIVGELNSISWANLPEGTYYFHLSVFNRDPTHCSLDGSLSIDST